MGTAYLRGSVRRRRRAAGRGKPKQSGAKACGDWRLVCRLRLVLPLVPDTTGTARSRTSPACLPALSSATYAAVRELARLVRLRWSTASPLGARFGRSGRGRAGGGSARVLPAPVPSHRRLPTRAER